MYLAPSSVNERGLKCSDSKITENGSSVASFFFLFHKHFSTSSPFKSLIVASTMECLLIQRLAIREQIEQRSEEKKIKI